MTARRKCYASPSPCPDTWHARANPLDASARGVGAVEGPGCQFGLCRRAGEVLVNGADGCSRRHASALSAWRVHLAKHRSGDMLALTPGNSHTRDGREDSDRPSRTASSR